jgi:hypothetical protein
MIRMLRAASIAAIVAGSLLLAGASTTLAAAVDPGTLTPPPPPGARCFTTGPSRVICDTFLNLDVVNQPDFETPCGLLYVTGTDERDGTRYYEDGLLVRRHITFDINVSWSLSPTGSGPTLKLIGHVGEWSVWPVPGVEGNEIVTFSGLDAKAIGPGLGTGFQIAGRWDPDGSHTGLFAAFSDESMAAICAALGG